MSLRAPARFSAATLAESMQSALDYEIASEKASSLGRAGDAVAKSMALLRAYDGEAAERRLLLKQAADAVWAYFIQRELCGLRRHDDAIREYGIPREVLVRLGAK
ncbi:MULTISPECIES: DUF6665 family protein [Mesorhizobium]|uniref:Uncharacterized protein n=1 Tax=Mesorhizobium denitrificans TaxID=2294114 RepID=A0A371XE35_9HYPH|nr:MULTISPECIES: DUF6665 family protein [Mesorhizobium]RFC67491.1 hypothetical protein DY251_10865 [Mesorhizobium denitrificans]